jgi:hypothetical protein
MFPNPAEREIVKQHVAEWVGQAEADHRSRPAAESRTSARREKARRAIGGLLFAVSVPVWPRSPHATVRPRTT